MMVKHRKRKSHNHEEEEASPVKLRKKEVGAEEEEEEEGELKMVKKKSKDKKKKRDRKKKKEKQYSTTPDASAKDISGEEPMSTEDVCHSSPSKSNDTRIEEVSQKSKQVDSSSPRIEIDLKKLFATDGPRPGGHHLHCNDIKDLLMFTVLGSGKWDKPTWCEMSAWKSIQHTLFVMVGYVKGEDYVVYKDCFKNINEQFREGHLVKNDGSEGSFLSPLVSCLNYKMKKKSAKRKQKASGGKNLRPSELLLTKEQRIVNEFPVIEEMDAEEREGYVSTRRDDECCANDEEQNISESSRMFSIDCEMCLSSNGKELTRISIVNENHDVVYDTYVKPEALITDYLTQYSGITANILQNVKTTIGDVQQRFLEIITKDDIIVGHSLDNDFRALKLLHDNIIDTSVIYGDQRGARFKPSLKNLVKLHLKREIQTNQSGHCSIEDAKACMELVQMKLEKGLHFGVFENHFESIFEAFSRADKTSSVIDAPTIVRQHCFTSTKGVLCSTDEQVVKGTKESIENSDFVFAHLKDFECLLKTSDANGRKPDESTIKMTLTKLDENIGLLLDDLSSNTLCVILLASGFLPNLIQKLQKEKEKRTLEEVKSAVRKARDCICFIKVKQ
eukprot:Seg1421.9 transcript_id=Seg1421.9/GoldUCD/mRNA.D3Y31 product="putative exonuclease" protein_id=Seg1421.9/GoldUCD/D3Y31